MIPENRELNTNKLKHELRDYLRNNAGTEGNLFPVAKYFIQKYALRNNISIPEQTIQNIIEEVVPEHKETWQNKVQGMDGRGNKLGNSPCL